MLIAALVCCLIQVTTKREGIVVVIGTIYSWT